MSPDIPVDNPAPARYRCGLVPALRPEPPRLAPGWSGSAQVVPRISIRLKPDTLALTIILAAMTALGPLATDMYLPSFPAIAAGFAATEAEVQATLSSYLIGFALGQIVYGPLSDSYGRRPILLGGFGLFVAASLVCTLAQGTDTLIAARALQGFGAAGPITLARAIVRDLYAGARAGQELSRMGGIMGLAPALAPAIGAALQAVAGWRTSFFLMSLFAASVAVMIAVGLPETLKVRRPEPMSLRALFGGFGVLLRHRGYRVCVALMSLVYAGIFAYLSSSSFILQGIYGLGQLQFALLFGLGAAAYVGGTVVAARTVLRRGVMRTIEFGVGCLFVAGVLQFCAMLAWPDRVAGLMVPMMLYLSAIGFVMPQSMAAAMEPFPERAGAASALSGMVQMSFAAVVGVVVGLFLAKSPLILPAATLLTGGASFVVFHVARARRLI